MPTLSFNDFLKRYGSDTTNNIELLEWGKELGIKGLLYVSKDELNSLPKSTKYILMNLQNHDQPGSHHVAIYNTPNYKFYFSSYGDIFSKEVLSFFNSCSNKNTIREYSDTQYQNFNQKYCGVISLFVLYKLFKGYKPIDILLELPYVLWTYDLRSVKKCIIKQTNQTKEVMGMLQMVDQIVI